MDQHLQTTRDFIQQLRNLPGSVLEREIAKPERFVIETSAQGGRRLETVWAPFDHINVNASIVIVGMTPGRHQMGSALRACHEQLVKGVSGADALAVAKVHASFSGPMRSNLVSLLDDIGIARHLGLSTTASLWAEASSMVHFTSALRYPVFVDGENYSGQPSMLRQPMLLEQLERWMGSEMQALPDAIYVPLGPKVSEALTWLSDRLGLGDARILSGLPHPSGASAERISYWLGRKPRSALSAKTNPDKLDAARASLAQKISALEVGQ